MPVPDRILKLTDQFGYNLDSYKSGKYNETQVRLEYINPLMEELGWDVTNTQGYSEAYKDVIHEDAVKVGGVTKAPDYCFRIGGTRKFFLEAKKPSVNIKEDTHPSYQLRRYAWSAKLPLSILTDFEEFAVYDCRVKPFKTDKASNARVMYLKFTDYKDNWDEIAGIFSHEAILKGSFDKYVESKRKKKGTAEVDIAFLEEIERWRELLARNIALRNPNLSQREVNFSVQRTIDRIIFLRICEDRGVEIYGRLMALQNGDRVYKRLFQLFREADARYNSGLFYFSAEKGRPNDVDALTPDLTVDDKVLKDILKNLYYPDSPYEFSVLPSNILGQVYEQFLGKVIRLTPAHRAVIEFKPEVRKAGGVYYTPTYIVDYIVKETVGKLVEGKKPGPRGGVSKLKILDPACGSGSFLLGAYQYLLDWHRDKYVKDDPVKWAKGKNPCLYQKSGDDWRLTTDERKRILLNNIYGVDIDHQAVEVTKLSLLLKVLEGEDEETIQRQLSLFQQRALPDLGNNIKCGNSLIGSDFYEGQQINLFDDEEMYRINAFDWENEFTDIMKNGGFDAVIGNPPYLRIQSLQEYYGDHINYFISHYKSAVKRFDLYLLFAEKGFNLLAKGGCLGFICPHKFINSDFGSGLRQFIIEKSALKSFISFGNNTVFRQASTYTGILRLGKDKNDAFRYYEFTDMPIIELPARLTALSDGDFAHYALRKFTSEPWVLTNQSAQLVLRKISQQPHKLDNVTREILVGVQSGIDNIHVLKKTGEPSGAVVKLFSERGNANIDIEIGLVKPFLRGEDVFRYKKPIHSYYCIYPYKLIGDKTKILEETELREKYPLGYAYLKEYRTELTQKRVQQKTNPKYWYSCHRSRNMTVFETDRIITPEISSGCNMTFAPAGIYNNTMVYSLLPHSLQVEHNLYWLGLLNSKILWWFMSNTGNVLRGGFFRFKTNYLKPFPIRTIDFADPTDAVGHDKMVGRVEQILSLHQKLAETKSPQTKTVLQRQIEATDRQIDKLVYKLYSLADKEIEIVEEASG